MFESYEVAYETYHQDQLVRREVFQAPKGLLIANFLRMFYTIQNDKRPLRIKMIRPVTFWDEFEQHMRTLHNEIVLDNKAMVTYKETQDQQ